jgi:hypothetical protein
MSRHKATTRVSKAVTGPHAPAMTLSGTLDAHLRDAARIDAKASAVDLVAKYNSRGERAPTDAQLVALVESLRVEVDE